MTFLILAIAIAVVVLTVFLIKISLRLRVAPPSKDQAQLYQDLGGIKTLMHSLEDHQRRIGEELVKFQVGWEAKKEFDVANRRSLERLEKIIAGTKSKGVAGENILAQALSAFPPEMVTPNFKVKGKEVEFGLVLANKKIVPIDSKWPSSELLETLSETKDEIEKGKIVAQIERELTRRVQEVTQYIDSSLTIPWAIAAVPDSVYALCPKAHLEAYRKNIILISYSMALPYLLSLFSLYNQYSNSIDYENLSAYLVDIKRNLDELLRILENKIQLAATMLSNALTEYRQIIGSMKGSISALESSKSQDVSVPGEKD